MTIHGSTQQARAGAADVPRCLNRDWPPYRLRLAAFYVAFVVAAVAAAAAVTAADAAAMLACQK